MIDDLEKLKFCSSKTDYLKELKGLRRIKFCFTKVDGSNRVLVSTPKIPVVDLPKGSSKKKENDNVISVYEENVGWRSIRVDSITSYEILDD